MQLPDLRPLAGPESPVTHKSVPTAAMSVRALFTVALCVTLLTHACLSAVVSPREKEVSKEEKVKNELEGSPISEEGNLENQDTNLKSGSKSSESSEESTSSAEKGGEKNPNLNSSSSESLENVNSQEESENKTKHKRSLDSNQDSLNKIIEGQNQTKEIGGLEKDQDTPTETDSLANDDTESTTKDDAEVTSTTASSGDASEEQASEPTTPETDTTTAETTATTDKTEVETFEFESETSENKEATSSAEENNGEEKPPSTEPSEESGPPNTDEEQEQSFAEMAMGRADKLSEQIRKVLMHYRKEGVVVVPGQSFFPEPMIMQDFENSFSIGRIHFKNMTVMGLSNFTVEHINTDVDKMQVYILLHMKQLVLLGNYTLSTIFSRSAGPFNVTLLNVDSEGVAAIETTPEGHLEASDSEMDMTTKEMLVDFKGLSSMFQSVVSAAGDALFDSIKPQILDRVNLVIRKDINEKLKEFSIKFVNKVAPVDLAFAEGRRYVKEHGYDPLDIDQHTFVVGGIVYINISEFTVQGLSRFHRVGNLSLSMDEGVIQFGVHVLTQQLTGAFNWSGQAFGIARSGRTNFTIDQLQVRALVNQSLDIRQKPHLQDLDLHLGWVKVTMDSPMTLNMMVQGIINAFPRLIKHMIVDALENPLKEKIQEILNQINVETLVNNNLPRLDSFGL